MKLSPLKDVAGMLRSFHYASHSGVLGRAGGGEKEAAQNRDLDAWARYWQTHVSAAFLRSYLKSVAGAAFMPNDPEELRLLLDVSILEKAIYELGYELNNRPSWVGIPLEGILETPGWTETAYRRLDDPDGGKDGFAMFDRLLAGAPTHLNAGGYLIVEIGSPQEAPARQRIEAHGGYELAKTVYDGSGHPRVLKARLRPAK